MKKNTLAWIIASKDINEFISPHKFMIKKICENFDELLILNLINFKIYDEYNFIKLKKGNNKFLNENNDILGKIKIFQPETEKELNLFLKDKKIVGINNIGKSFSDLKIHLILKKENITMIHFGNIGNLQFTQKSLKGNMIKGLIFGLKKKISKKIFSFLSIIKVIPKNEINFTSDVSILKNIEKSKLKKFYYKNNLFYSKKIEIVNSRAHDNFFDKKIDTLEESQITYLDFNLDHEFQLSLRGKLEKLHVERYYKNVIKCLKDISKILEKKIVICIHPRDNLSEKKKIFNDFDVFQNVTRENIVKSYLVIFFDSSAIIDAVLMKKRIVTLTSKDLDENMLVGSNIYRDKIGIKQINIENYKELKKEQFIKELNYNIKNYDNYIENNISPDGNEIGYKKIFKRIKEDLF